MPDAENKKPDSRRATDFISKIVTDPANPPRLMRLNGYKGASSEDGHIRLYANPELSLYFEIPEGDVVYESEVAGADPQGMVTLYVKSDSKIISSQSKHQNQEQSQGGGQPPMYNYPYATGAQAAPQGAAEGFHFTPTIHSIYVHCTFPPPPTPHCTLTITHHPPICTFPPSPHFCTITQHPQLCTIPVSPYCTPNTFTPTPHSVPTTPQTTPAGGVGVQAAAMAGPQAGANAPLPFSQLPYACPPSPVPYMCPPSPLTHCPPTPLTHCPPTPLTHCPPTPLTHCPPTPPTFCPPPHTPFCPPTPPTFCPPHTPFCPPTPPNHCPPHTPFCPTHPIVCLYTPVAVCTPVSPLPHCYTPATPASPLCTPNTPISPVSPVTPVTTPASVAGGGF